MPPPADPNQQSSMAAPPPLPLFDEFLKEVLLRIVSDDPVSLLCAVLVCKRWVRLVSGRGFHRRFRDFHCTAPMLGAIVNKDGFIPTSSFRCHVLAKLRRGWMVLDARHGRVLFHNVCCGSESYDPTPSIWGPITGKQLELPRLPRVPEQYVWFSNFVVLCATASCNHLDCSHGPFLVVFVVVGCSLIRPHLLVRGWAME